MHTGKRHTHTQSNTCFPHGGCSDIYSPQSPSLLQESCLFECQRSITDLTTLSAPCPRSSPFFTSASPLPNNRPTLSWQMKWNSGICLEKIYAFPQHPSVKRPELLFLFTWSPLGCLHKLLSLSWMFLTDVDKWVRTKRFQKIKWKMQNISQDFGVISQNAGPPLISIRLSLIVLLYRS